MKATVVRLQCRRVVSHVDLWALFGRFQALNRTELSISHAEGHVPDDQLDLHSRYNFRKE